MSHCCGPNTKKSKKSANLQPELTPSEGTGLNKTNLILGLSLVLIAGLAVGYLFAPMATTQKEFGNLTTSEQRAEWIEEANIIRGSLAVEGQYDCCLEKPCLYCIYKTPGHGEGAACQCRQDILNGEHPCGECIGEILEGNGLSELAPYYAKAIAHKVGEQHLGHLESIINEMYELE